MEVVANPLFGAGENLDALLDPPARENALINVSQWSLVDASLVRTSEEGAILFAPAWNMRNEKMTRHDAWCAAAGESQQRESRGSKLIA